jgi:hypothetical protein
MFERPKNPEKLLQNLKIAMDKNLVLQPAFADKAVLLKFFNGRQVKRKAQSGYSTSDSFELSVVVDDVRFPQMTVTVRQGTATSAGYEGAAGHTPTHVRRIGELNVNVGAVPGFTVCMVRDVFGRDSRSEVEYGSATDGVTYVPDKKGTAVYEYPGDPITVGQPPGTKEVKFEVKLDDPERVAEMRMLLPMPHRKIRNRDAINDLRLYEQEG